MKQRPWSERIRITARNRQGVEIQKVLSLDPCVGHPVIGMK